MGDLKTKQYVDRPPIPMITKVEVLGRGQLLLHFDDGGRPYRISEAMLEAITADHHVSGVSFPFVAGMDRLHDLRARKRAHERSNDG